MNRYVLYWTPTQEQNFAQMFPELDQENANYENPTPEWENGYNWVEQDLTPEQFVIVDGLANNHICIDVKPAPRPSGNPLGR